MSIANTINPRISLINVGKKELDELLECGQPERKKYNENQIIKEVALACTTEDCDLPANVQSKLFATFMNVELSDKGKLLGLPALSMPEFTEEERDMIKRAVEQGIAKKSNTLFQELNELGINFNGNEQSKEDEVLFNSKKELNEKQQLYVSKLQELISLYEDVIKLNSKSFPKLANENIEMYTIKLNLYSLQSKLLNAKFNVSVFKETEHSLEAYKQLIQDILQQQTECQQEISDLELLKEKYKQVSCQEYDNILKKFLKYKAVVDKKNLLSKRKQKKDNDM